MSIFKNDKNLNENEEDKLKKYYEGFIDGYADNAGNKIISSNIYKIDDRLVSKNLLEINYPDDTSNLLEVHIFFVNGFNYFFTYQTEKQPSQNVLEDKKNFFNSLSYN